MRFSGADEQEVLEQLQAAIVDHRRGVLSEPSKETVGEFLQRWLRDSVKNSVRDRTHRSYAGLVNNHITPELGTIKLQKLTPAHVQRLYGTKIDEGLSPRTVRYIGAVLNRALEQAVKCSLVPRNVCKAADKPRKEQRNAM